ncbi:hypothetical protein ABK040_009268 [Willaertia magna]
MFKLSTVLLSVILVTLFSLTFISATNDRYPKLGPEQLIQEIAKLYQELTGKSLLEDNIEEESDSFAPIPYEATTNLNVRSGPGTNYQVIKTIAPGTKCDYYGENSNGWFHLVCQGVGGSVWASSSYLRQVSGSTGGGNTGSNAGQIAANFARSKVGGCYSQAQRMGNPCYDCSSLVYLAYKQAGKNFPTNTREYPGNTRDVTGQSLQIGDILWKQGHVGMYVGNNQVVNAENPNSGIKIRDLDWYKRYIGFTKVYRAK